MANRFSNYANAFRVTLTSGVGASDTTYPVTTTSGGPTSPCYIVIDPGNDAKREIIFCDGTFDATNFRSTSTTNRHLDGSAAPSGLTHSAGASVVVVPVAQHFRDLHDRVTSHAHGTDTDGANVPLANVTGHTQSVHTALGLRASMVGEVVMSARSDVPTGWLECNGQAISRTTYSALFSSMGTTYGVGNGTTTFNLPNLAGRVPIGAGTLGSDTYARGSTGGEAAHALTTAELAAHTHAPGTLATGSNGNHAHNVSVGPSGGLSQVAQETTTNTLSQVVSGFTGSHTHSLTGATASTGSGTAHENRPPYLGVTFLVYHGVGV